ncbi:MAG TPA: MFS transporter [Ktedonobacteraceae bacterium]|nr:MFS transporter [Ktedonobacteraceae bacterium]
MATQQRGFLHRELSVYPATSQRVWFLTLAVAATFVLYYEAYVLPSVAPLALSFFGISFSQYIFLNVLLGALGAVSSLLGSLSDRIGRANLVVYGVLLNSLIILSLTLTTSAWSFLLISWFGGFLEGIILVATPALVRDFSPRLGRATAMAFWTIGPVGGSLLATTVASQTLPIFGTWQSQYLIAGIVGLIISVLCFFGLRDLSAPLRAQIMVSTQEKALLEARARGIDVEASMKHPWRQMLKSRIILSAFGVSVFLLTYYAFVGYGPILFTNIFGYSLPLANGLLGIYWIVDICASIIGGIISDRLEVRKPLMLIFTVATIIVGIVFITRIGQPTSAVFMGVLLGLSALTGPIAYVTWMAAYTETLEEVNPALVATGIAVWGFVVRVVVVLSTLGFGFVVQNVQNPTQWSIWWWVGIAGYLVFLPTISLNTGYWSPARARAQVAARLEEEGIEVDAATEPGPA